MNKNPYSLAWGDAIRTQRTALGLTRRDLAERVEVTPTMVGYWEQGRHAPSPRMQALLIQTLGIDPVTVSKIIIKGGSGDAA